MNNEIHNSAELSALYRASRSTVDGLDADTLQGWLDGTLSAERKSVVAAQLAASPAARALVAMLTELEPESAALADAVAERRALRHAISRRQPQRVAAPAARPRRVARWFGAVAASALAVIAIFAFHGAQQSSGDHMASEMDNRPDQIFAMREDRIFKPTLGSPSESHGAGDDRLFGSSFTKGG